MPTDSGVTNTFTIDRSIGIRVPVFDGFGTLEDFNMCTHRWTIRCDDGTTEELTNEQLDFLETAEQRGSEHELTIWSQIYNYLNWDMLTDDMEQQLTHLIWNTNILTSDVKEEMVMLYTMKKTKVTSFISLTMFMFEIL